MSTHQPLDTRVKLRCTHAKCPRSVVIPWEATMPTGTAEIVTPCPWHSKQSDNAPEEHYYDADGRWWDGEQFIACGDTESEAL